MIGLLLKTARETWLATLLFGAGLCLVEVLLNFILPQIYEELDSIWLQMPVARAMLEALLGIDVGDKMTVQVIMALVWVHPVVLALLWAHEIIHCTRLPAAEIDRGTIDVFFGLPVARWTAYACESAVWLAGGAFLMVSAVAGYAIGASLFDGAPRPEPARIALVVANLYALYLAVGGGAYLVSAMSSRRGRAISVVFAVLLASFLLNFLAQYWAPAKAIAFLGVLDYYQPAHVLMAGTFPARDVAVLLAFAAAAWTAGGVVLARRSICTV